MDRRSILLVVLSLVFSSLIWSVLQLNEDQISELDVPLRYLNKETSQSFSGYPSVVRISVRGLGFNILRLHLLRLSANYDFNNLLIDSKSFVPENVQLDTPPNLSITILDIIPVSSTISADQKIVKAQIPINLIFQDRASESFFLKMNYQINISNAEIQGDDDVVSRVKSIDTQSISSKVLTKDRVKIKLIKPHPDLLLINDFVYLTRDGASLSSKIMTNVPISHKLDEPVFPNNVTIWLKGPIHTLDVIRNQDIVVSLNETSDDKLSVSVVVPPDVELVDFSPKFVMRQK